MTRYILALDQGTSSSRTILFDDHGQPVHQCSEEFPTHYPKTGWVEQDAKQIWASQLSTMQKAIEQSGVDVAQIAAIGITNQRETTIAWDRETGEPLAPAIVWQCRRTAQRCEELKKQGHSATIRSKTGLVTDAYFSATKMEWLLQNVPAVKTAQDEGRLAFGTVDSWLIWKLTGGKQHVTDPTNASRTMVYNIHDLRWDEELMALFGVKATDLPTVKPSSGLFGQCVSQWFGKSVPIGGVAGDQQASLFGQGCFESGQSKNTYGTGCFLLMNIGQQPIISENGLLTTIACQLGEKVTYALEGAVFMGGALIQWIRDQLGLIQQARESEAMALEVGDTDGVYIVPAFTGLGAPHWDPFARGIITGLTRGAGKNHIVRAALEAIAFQSLEVLKLMESETKLNLPNLRVDGGAVANNFLMQFQSDILHKEVIRPKVAETTALGAAYLAGLAVGIWKSPDELVQYWHAERKFTPSMSAAEIETKLNGWKRAVELSKGWAK